jgi:hypothetical protein
MRYLLRIVAIVASLVLVAMAVCAGPESSTPAADQAVECALLPASDVAPVVQAWPDSSPCAGESRTIRFKALPDGTAVACDPAARVAAVWQNAGLVEAEGDGAEARCATLCRDPGAPGDPSRCSAPCRDRLDPSRCDPTLVALRWRLPEAAELETLLLDLNDHPCSIEGCRMDPALSGACEEYWAAGPQDADAPAGGDRAFADMRGGGVGYAGPETRHLVRCVADRP